MKTIIIGAGISGISAAYHLKQKGINAIIYEKDNEWGGLCGNFEINGFRFDKAIHLSFTEDEYVKKLFSESSKYIAHNPIAYNYYEGTWLKHPAQNNLYPLNTDEKIRIIKDILENPNKKTNLRNYEEWLKAQYGNYFSENFPMRYTRKYWGCEAKDLSTTWVGNRMYKPKIEEVLRGSFESETPNTYYAKEMRYPVRGGYKAFLQKMVETCDIRLNKKAIKIDPSKKIIYFEDNSKVSYQNLISSISLPEYSNLIKEMPQEIQKACQNLQYTSVALVSIGLNKPDIPCYLWFYIYDEEILASRCYSPNLKSIDNVPQGCSSMQFEIYFLKSKHPTQIDNSLIEHIIQKSEKMGLFQRDNVIVKDLRILEYANVIFYHGMEYDRMNILNYLRGIGIKAIGRFGEWDYLWSDQSLLSGKKVQG